VVDVAVGAAYQLRYTPAPLEGVCQLLAAYHREMPLEEQEVDLLFDLIATRLASALTITAWHSTHHPENREYIMRNAGSHGAMLSRFEKMPRKDVQRRLRAACDQDAP
jgi:hydroxylysine kinase